MVGVQQARPLTISRSCDTVIDRAFATSRKCLRSTNVVTPFFFYESNRRFLSRLLRSTRLSDSRIFEKPIGAIDCPLNFFHLTATRAKVSSRVHEDINFDVSLSARGDISPRANCTKTPIAILIRDREIYHRGQDKGCDSSTFFVTSS